MESIGMVGVGAMGLALLERLKLAGVEATVYDTPSAVT
jgi:3-hydroxyisobutyrate dehydrogenase-like beta-hydroxyacid dehydrogenase